MERTVTQILHTDVACNSYMALTCASALVPRRPFSGLSLSPMMSSREILTTFQDKINPGCPLFYLTVSKQLGEISSRSSILQCNWGRRPQIGTYKFDNISR